MKAIAAIVAIASVTQGQGAITLNVVVAPSGTVVLDGRALKDDNELADRARDAVRKSSDVRAVIAADKSVSYGRVIAVMDALKRGGVTRLSFAVAP
jgi:biopolymer transport protein ExbD